MLKVLKLTIIATIFLTLSSTRSQAADIANIDIEKYCKESTDSIKNEGNPENSNGDFYKNCIENEKFSKKALEAMNISPNTLKSCKDYTGNSYEALLWCAFGRKRIDNAPNHRF